MNSSDSSAQANSVGTTSSSLQYPPKSYPGQRLAVAEPPRQDQTERVPQTLDCRFGTALFLLLMRQ